MEAAAVTVTSAVRKALAYRLTRGQLIGYTLKEILAYMPEQLTQRARTNPGANASDEAKLVAAFAKFIAAAQKLDEVTQALPEPLLPDTGARQPAPHGAENLVLGHVGELAIVPYGDPPAPQGQPRGPGRRGPAVHVQNDWNAPQPVGWMSKARRWILTWKRLSALLFLLSPIWSLVVPKLIVFVVGRLFTRMVESFFRGAVLATEQALDEAERAVERMATSAVSTVIHDTPAAVGGAVVAGIHPRTVPSWVWLTGMYLMHRVVSAKFGSADL